MRKAIKGTFDPMKPTTKVKLQFGLANPCQLDFNYGSR
jgi:hypothetical protein